jgi:hypothetical protein
MRLDCCKQRELDERYIGRQRQWKWKGVSYSVGVNKSTAPRTGVIRVANRCFVVSQSGAPVSITSVSVAGKRLFVFGENFDAGAVILLNGEA